MDSLRFPPPEEAVPKTRVHPVFLPFQGCPTRCVFCAQTLQTGNATRSLHETFDEMRRDLAALAAANAPPRELAFYGGTFTCLPPEDQLAGIKIATAFRDRGLITLIRASTRPDALQRDHLATLRKAGLNILELGVQSFNNEALSASRRGYDEQTALDACRAVTEAGLTLGIQLLPGMPGMTPAMLPPDMERVAAAKPKYLRLYPCLVLKGTELAAKWEAKAYTPWSLDETIAALAPALLRAWDERIRVIRIGLAPEASLDNGGILAGPRHPSLGSLIRGRALFLYITRYLEQRGQTAQRLALPRRFQGEFWGHGNSLAAAYAKHGLTRANVCWHDEEYCQLD